jgi:hypothetical protein
VSNYDLDDVCDRLENIEAAVKKNHLDVNTWVWSAVFFVIAFSWIPDTWHSKLRYSLQYGVSYSQVTIGKKPTDCTFLRAPMGDKDCHYDREVSTIKVETNQWGGQSISWDDGKTWTQTATGQSGVPIKSEDNGKTWSADFVPPHMEPEVDVGWMKVDEDKQ